eukprot:CAMPEP_0115874698 /NCGR_PEP_ID=MMETSP0287-20121206/24684_1 /TAXON_ID=412157 /ORGANISM="Chrysochromulina rotalis, Strain UIO044" /LENGTH=63 /DNA_ID=CAMNT_0003329875 /DNA_START=69 /DNA_END=257 /DNA_ORIENTATION=-
MCVTTKLTASEASATLSADGGPWACQSGSSPTAAQVPVPSVAPGPTSAPARLWGVARPKVAFI